MSWRILQNGARASFSMQFRDHPLLSYKGLPTWPPMWVGRDPAVKVRLDGEIGILREVKTYDLSSKTCFLVIDHDGASYMGCLFIDDKVFRSQVADIMKRCI